MQMPNSEFIEDGGIYEAAKDLNKKIWAELESLAFSEAVNDALADMYWQGWNDAKADSL